MGTHMRVDPAHQESGQVKSEPRNPEQQERIRRRGSADSRGAGTRRRTRPKSLAI